MKTEITAAERHLDGLGGRERRLWDRMRIEPERWAQGQYEDLAGFWVVAVLGRRCLYYQPVEAGWGWGRYETWGEISTYHWGDADEINDVVCWTMFALDHGGSG